MIRWRWLLACALCCLSTRASAEFDLHAPNRAQRVADLITEVDLAAATDLLEHANSDSQALAFERARLSIYLGDCDRASAILSGPAFAEAHEAASLADLAKSCAGVTAAGFVIEDKASGVWLRLQDDADRVLAPFIFEVAGRAREAISREIGTNLPRPLRIELVRDLFSLSGVTGLPVTAAETTGTLAVARWGRVTMLSPRAVPAGYPWQDTLAHEITHLLVTRASRDFAPLWLQEGLAKRFETRWRDPRPFDRPEWADEATRAAMLSGRSVGIDKLGPSIAMLPTPEAAATAFAEVTSFVHYWIDKNGEAALRLLLMDLRGNGRAGADAALISVTGRDLQAWDAEWRTWLAQTLAPQSAAPAAQRRNAASPMQARDFARRRRLAQILLGRGSGKASLIELDPVLSASPRDPLLKFRAASAYLQMGDPTAAERTLSTDTEIDAPYAPWYALSGRFAREHGDEVRARGQLDLGLALDPLDEFVACEGHARGASQSDLSLPERPAWRALCVDVRKAPEASRD